MTQEEIHDFVRQVIEQDLIDNDRDLGRVVATIVERWSQDNDEAFQDGLAACICDT